MQFDVITLFPEMFSALSGSGITRRAFEENRCSLTLWNPRDFTHDKHRTVDRWKTRLSRRKNVWPAPVLPMPP